MSQVPVTPEEAAFIRERIERFEQEAPADMRWQVSYVRENRALPLYVGWTETAGVRPDGTLVRWSTEEEWPGVRELADAPWVNIALTEGAKRYPELRRLIPQRPAGARTCEQCAGSGTIRNLPDDLKKIICTCGGVGWLES
ncbi:MAG TPA: hypothetical protein VGG33_26955 [Polyangia bacterium]